jgi:hypothetical protein
MKMAQYKDGRGNWINIPAIGIPQNPENLAYQYCLQHGLLTRVVDINGSEVKVTKEFKSKRRAR